MLGRAVMLAAGALLLTGSASAQDEAAGQSRTRAVTEVPAHGKEARLAPAVPDPLTPPEVERPPLAAPAPVLEEPTASSPAAADTSTPQAPPAGDVATTPAPQAPVAPTVSVATQPDPVLTDVRRRLATPRGREAGGDAADRAALTAFYAAENARVVWTDETGLTARAQKVIAEIAKADDWGLVASAFDLPRLPAGSPDVQARADAEIKLGMAILRYARHARGGRLDPQSVSKTLDRKPQVFEPRSLIQAAAAASAPDAYLRGLHPKHAGFRNLQKALVAARTTAAEPVVEQTPPDEPSASDRKNRGKAGKQAKPAPSSSETIRRIVVNMERWRWMPDDLGAFHIWNNVPEQMTVAVKDGKVVFHERIVVGKPDTATPNFSANMRTVVFQPEWGVPPGIKNNEIGPLLRRASAESGGWFGSSGRPPSSVLARHNLRVVSNGQVLNPDSINWSQVDVNRFSFIQPSGPQNVLGVVKFMFPNKHDVYMHDTPQKHLFSSPVRTYSHGCMRVQNPVRFAEVLLEHDKGWSADRVRSMVPRGGEVRLTSEIPVHNVYFTAVADETGKLKTYSDLYGMDSRVASALEGRAVAIASRGEAVSGEAPASTRVSERVRGERPARQQRASAASGSQGTNPFAGLFGN